MAENLIETARLLVVSRESALLAPLWSVAQQNSWEIEPAGNPWDAVERVQSGIAPHLLLLDMPRRDADSLHLLRWLRRLRPDLPVIVTCFPEDAGRKREAMRLGAQEVLIRPFDEASLEAAIQRHLVSPENEEAEVTSEDIEQLGPDSFFVSASPITQKLRAQAELLAEADVPVLIVGEAGSGKDTVARLIHKLSVRSGFNFLKVNCADMPAELLEAELFGSERSPSPSAFNRIGPGKFERADKGTVFLDEITEMPLSAQARLMHVLQDKVLLPADGDKARSVDVRILAATSANLDRMFAERKLREDLYHRLSSFTVQVPALRQRKSEIPVLLQHSMHQLARHYGLPPRDFSPAMIEACQRHAWPGNLDELESFVKRYLVAGDNELTFGEGKSALGDGNGTRLGRASRQTTVYSEISLPEADRSGSKSLKSLINTVKCEAERNAIGTALQKTGWNRKAAARLLQVSYRTLLYKIEQYQMSASESVLSPFPGSKVAFNGSSVKANGKTS
ncbi:MAG TPA: sigma-54 dependent transcriptional regulator [Candidatus Aquilonibacter sp.]|nr:sigma-54 dependent transcriptional regulator [Candidatus Aquilonibacter sp.]